MGNRVGLIPGAVQSRTALFSCVLPDFSIAHPAGVGVTSIKPIDLFTAFLVVIHAAYPAQERVRAKWITDLW